MKIVILDGHTLNPGDLNWDALEQFGELIVYPRTGEEEIYERAKDASIIFTNKVPLTAAILQQLNKLKYIGVLATGYNIVDVHAAKKQGIIVTNVPGYSTSSVAQLCFALILEFTHHVQRHSDLVHEGKWSSSPDFSFWNYPLTELADKTLGILGYGTIGKQVARIAVAFGMQVIYHSRNRKRDEENEQIRWVEKAALFSQSDYLSLHCPLTPETTGIINRENLDRMKKNSFLINTSRGPLIVEEDLANALNNGTIAGAGLDVLSKEPPKVDNILLTAKNCIITPHIAWASIEARSRLLNLSVSNLRAFVDGNPVNVVN